MTGAELVREIAQPLAGEARDYDALLQLIGDARFVLIGEASHGTHEFYFERAAITKRLIAEKSLTVNNLDGMKGADGIPGQPDRPVSTCADPPHQLVIRNIGDCLG